MYAALFLILTIACFIAGIYIGCHVPIIVQIIFVVIAIAIKPYLMKKDDNHLYMYGFVSALYLSTFGGIAIGNLLCLMAN